MGDTSKRTRRFASATLAAVAATFAAAAPAAAEFGSPAAGPTLLELLADPASEPRPPAVGSPATPEDDLEAQLKAIAAASDAAQAQASRAFALAILDGGAAVPDDRVYKGIPLLNFDPAAKVKTVPANGEVVVRQVRFGDHTLSDTWLLKFTSPNDPYTIVYEVAELEGAFGGELAPLALTSTDGLRGLRPVVQPLDWEPTNIGTKDKSRFTPGGMSGPGANEKTRTVVQQVRVPMPAPGADSLVLDPSAGPQAGRSALATMHAATAEREAVAVSIGQLDGTSPERLIWDSLQDPLWDQVTTDPAALQTVKDHAQDNVALVGEMRVRVRVPSGVDPGGAHATITLSNNEAYISRTGVRPPADGQVVVKVANKDDFAHSFEALALQSGKPLHDLANQDATFGWSRVTLPLLDTIAAGETRTVTVSVPADATALWIGDPGSGDQAGALLDLERGPVTQGFRFQEDFAAPLHVTEDRAGHMWVTLEGLDRIARLKPGADLAASPKEEFTLPPHPDDPSAPLAPHDIMVDGNGILWATLTLGNAIVRIDPSQVADGTSSGIRSYQLPPCPPAPACGVDFPPVPGELPTRGPLQMQGMIDGDGHTTIFFTQMNSNHIGALKVAADGSEIDQTEFDCACDGPLGIALGSDGSVWFSEADGAPNDPDDGSRLGRLRLDPTRPFAASSTRIDHYDVPNCVHVVDPLHPDGVCTVAPHSLVIDGEGRVWYTGEANGEIGHLDPAQATPDTENGFTSWPAGDTDFRALPAPADIAADRSGRVFWADEYGDIVGTATASGPDHATRFRPLERRSLTDEPFVDSSGNLWFLELGANLLTRVSNVTEAAPLRAAPPAQLEARTSDDLLRGQGLRDMSAVDVKVLRDGAVVAQAADVAVQSGGFEVGPGGWQGTTSGDVIRPGDRIELQPEAEYPRAPLSFTLATLTAGVQPGGAVAGDLEPGGHAVGDTVTVQAGGQTRSAGVRHEAEGRVYRTAPIDGLDPATATGTVAWSGATSAAIFRTVTRFGPQAQEPAPPADPGQVPEAPTTPHRADPPGSAPQQSQDDAPPAAAPPAAGAPPAGAGACEDRAWLTVRRGRPSIGLLGWTEERLEQCFGRPIRRRSTQTVVRVRRDGRLRRVRVRAEVLRYGRTLEAQLVDDRVVDYDVLSGRLRAEPGGLTVRSAASLVTRTLRGVKLDRRRRVYRGLVRISGRTYADVSVRVSRSRRPRVTRISVTQITGTRPRAVPVIRRAR